MFKKSLVAVAVLGAAAFSAQAADVTLYGRVDTGFAYTNTDSDVAGADKQHTFGMETGFSTGNRWGLKGTEDLGNGMKVGFVLESGFNADTGAMGDSERLFNREATLSVAGDFGTLYFGRMNTLASDGGSMAMMGNASVIGNGMDALTMKRSTGSNYARYDNVIGYVTPSFGGFKVAAQYSTGQKGEVENKASANRYGALGVEYAGGGLIVDAVAEYYIWGHGVGEDPENGVAFQVGGNYNFGVVQPFAKVAYFKDMPAKGVLESYFWSDKDYGKSNLEGYGVELGVKTPVAGGTAFAAVSFRDAEDVTDSAKQFKRFGVGTGYSYPFSKRTNVYGAVGYAQEKGEGIADERKPNRCLAGVGLVHKF